MDKVFQQSLAHCINFTSLLIKFGWEDLWTLIESLFTIKNISLEFCNTYVLVYSILKVALLILAIKWT